jgi:hypothetical protein
MGDFKKQVMEIRTNLARVKDQIASAAEKSGRTADDVQLVSVTKMVPVEIIAAGIDAGMRCFGENYAERAAEKIRSERIQKATAATSGVEWHMIGHVQSRKTDTVCEYFSMVHSVDRMKIANYLNRYCGEHGRNMPVLLEVNISGEESKYGWKAWKKDDWEALLTSFSAIGDLPHLTIRGLMSMPPFFDDPEKTRPFYQRLRELQAFLKDNLPEISWDELSIGTTFDFPVAVEEGATIVRIGTAIFGEREK